MDKPIAKSNNRVRELRLTYHLTQSELAEKTNLSYSSIVSYENGLRDPNARAMAALEKFFGVTGEYLLMELASETEAYEKPDFIGMEVTGDKRFYNSHLLGNPFSKWRDKIGRAHV